MPVISENLFFPNPVLPKTSVYAFIPSNLMQVWNGETCPIKRNGRLNEQHCVIMNNLLKTSVLLKETKPVPLNKKESSLNDATVMNLKNSQKPTRFLQFASDQKKNFFTILVTNTHKNNRNFHHTTIVTKPE